MRKIPLAAAVSLILASGGAQALGLGDIEMRSALNQPMNAKIPLTSVQAGELAGMIVQLASPEAFVRAGIDRSQVLAELEFEIDETGAEPVIRITSDRPVLEPFLNFLIEVDWPAGRMVREYTVLLDPPVFLTPSATATPDEAPATVDRSELSQLAPTPIVRDQVPVQDADVVAGSEVDDGGKPALAGEGEIVSLDSLSAEAADAAANTPVGPSANTPADGALPVETLGGLADARTDESTMPETAEGEIVALTDLAAPNTAAQEEARRQAALDRIPDVQLLGGTSEVADDFVVAPIEPTLDTRAPLAGVESDGSEIVLLEELDAPASGARQGASETPASEAPASDVNVAPGDTLYEIAQANLYDGATVQQMMLALLDANQQAFINGNINLVRSGANLSIPDATAVEQISQNQALARIAEQNSLWQEYRDTLRGATQLASTDAPESAPVPADDSADDSADALAEVADSASGSAADAATDSGQSELSSEAQAILDEARAEVRAQEELRILGAGDSQAASADAVPGDGDEGSEAALAKLSEQAQLLREELTATRLESEDLSDQAGALQSTSENLDALVALRQNDVARLESQLVESREAAEAEAAAAEQAAADEAAEATMDTALTESEQATGGAEASLGDAAGAAVDATADAGAGRSADAAADSVADAAADAADAADEAANDTQQATNNALSEAGVELGEVELIDGTADAAGSGSADSTAAADVGNTAAPESIVESIDESSDVQTAPAAGAPWYQSLLSDPNKLMIAGAGGAGLLGLIALLFVRRKRDDDYDELADFEDDVEFIEDADAARSISGTQGDRADLTDDGMTVAFDKGDVDTATTRHAPKSGTEAGMGAGAAAAAGMAGAAVAASGHDTDDIDKDDTIAEADVYLAYGLHGQAEDLLTSAIDRNATNPEYHIKLLQTYHAQGNSEGFGRAAADYQQRFGEQDERWSSIAGMGAELEPGNPLYAAASSSVASIGLGSRDSSMNFGDDDFQVEGDESTLTGSITRDFGAAGEATDFTDDAQDDPLDQSLDPGMAFNEADLEATGDFSHLSDEISDELEQDPFATSTDSHDADAPSSGVVAGSTLGGVAAVVAAGAATAGSTDGEAAVEGSIDAPELLEEPAAVDSASVDSTNPTDGLDFASALDEDPASALDGALSLDDLDVTGNDLEAGDGLDQLDLSAAAADLTVDLDQLSEDIDLDSTSLFEEGFADAGVIDMEGDLTGLGADSTDTGADEMDTMMDLAKAYIDMGDKDLASSALDQIVKGGSPQQVTEAETLLRKIS